VLAAVVDVASYLQIGTFKQPGDKSSFFSYGSEGSCFVVTVQFSWLVVLMNRERLVM
jgi:hypothetical protein